MQFTIAQSVLLSALKSAVQVVETRQALPILGNLFLEVINSELHIHATDCEVEIACTLPLSLESRDGQATIPAEKFLKICNEVSQEFITVEHETGSKFIDVKLNRLSYRLATLPVSDYPTRRLTRQVLDNPNAYKVVLTQNKLREFLSSIKFAMANQDVRYSLNGICLDLCNGRLSVVATDGHRLAMCSEPFDLEERDPIQVIIPRVAVLAMYKMLGKSNEAVELTLTEEKFKCVISPQLTVHSKLIDWRYPDYYSVIPRKPEFTAQVNTKDFKQALSRVSTVVNEKYKGVVLFLSQGSIKASAHHSESSERQAEEVLPIQYTGDDIEVGFNISYLLDILSAIKSKEIELHFTDASSGWLITPTEIYSPQYVVMPMRL